MDYNELKKHENSFMPQGSLQEALRQIYTHKPQSKTSSHLAKLFLVSRYTAKYFCHSTTDSPYVSVQRVDPTTMTLSYGELKNSNIIYFDHYHFNLVEGSWILGPYAPELSLL